MPEVPVCNAQGGLVTHSGKVQLTIISTTIWAERLRLELLQCAACVKSHAGEDPGEKKCMQVNVTSQQHMLHQKWIVQI